MPLVCCWHTFFKLLRGINSCHRETFIVTNCVTNCQPAMGTDLLAGLAEAEEGAL